MLAGDLTEFSLPDLFQLLALTRKSGALRVAQAGTEGRVYFADGEVYFALADECRLPLGARLVSGGHLRAERLQELLREHRGGSAVEVAAQLVESNEVDAETLDAFVAEQVYDALFALLRLEEGRFEFDGDVDVQWEGQRHAGPELLEEAGRRLDEWRRLAEHVPSSDAVLALVPNPPGEAPLSLSRPQWHLLSLVDGLRTVAEIVDVSGQGEFAAGKLIGELVELGLVEAHGRAGEGALAELLAGRNALRQLEEVALGAGTSASSPLATPRSSAPPLAEAMRDLESAGPPVPGAAKSEEPEPEPEPEDPEPLDLPAVAGFEELADLSEIDAPANGDAAEAVEAEYLREPDDAEGDEPDAVEDVESEGEAPEPGELEEEAEEPDEAPMQLADHRPATSRTFDRAQVARELASLGFDDEPGAGANGSGHTPHLMRDDDVNRGLLLRLIDGVKGA